MDISDFRGPMRRVNHCDPVVGPPAGEETWIVEPEEVDVCPVHEVVRQDGDVAAVVVRSDDADARRIVALQRRDKLLRPAAGQHLCVVVDAVEVVDVVEVGFQHRVVLRPGRLPGVVAHHQGQTLNGDVAVTAGSSRRRRVELSLKRVAQPLIAEHLIAAVVRQVELVDEIRTGRMTERRQKRAEELELRSDVAV